MKKPATLHDLPPAPLSPCNPELLASVGRFKALHGVLQQTVAGTKLLKYFLGLEVSNLCSLHSEVHGERRGGDQKSAAAKIKADTLSSLTLEEFIEAHLGVTARTARKYRSFFEALASGTAHEATVKRLNAFWLARRETMLALPSSKRKRAASSSALSLHSLSSIAAQDLQTILAQPDEWGLHELFEVPIKSAGGDATEAPLEQPAPKHPLVKFWLKDFSRRALQNEYLRLRKQDQAALLTTLEEVTAKLRENLAPKKGKK